MANGPSRVKAGLETLTTMWTTEAEPVAASKDVNRVLLKHDNGDVGFEEDSRPPGCTSAALICSA